MTPIRAGDIFRPIDPLDEDHDPYLTLAAAGPGSEVDKEEENDVDMTDAPLVSNRFVDNEAGESDSPPLPDDDDYTQLPFALDYVDSSEHPPAHMQPSYQFCKCETVIQVDTNYELRCGNWTNFPDSVCSVCR